MSYVQNTENDRDEMLGRIGISSLEELLQPLDDALRVKGALNLDPPMSEAEVVSLCSELAGKNRPASGLASFLGGGVYDRYIPAVVRYVLSRSEFYTSYTPYQAEVSQGTLQTIYEYQSLICRLTGMEAANASMYDGATALAEAVLMACGIKRINRVLIPRALSSRIKAVLESYTAGRGIEIEEVPFTKDGTVDLTVMKKLLKKMPAAVVIAQPNYFGIIERASEISDFTHSKGALLVAFVDPISLAVLSPPGEYDADIAVGEGQSLGNPQNFGGPLLGFMATKKSYIRKCPGRLVSSTVDQDGNRGYVMTLQTREQHIRRERATSNICTNEGLCALAAAVYLTALGEKGFKEVAMQSMAKSHTLHRMLSDVSGCRFPFKADFFQEFVLDVGIPAKEFLSMAKSRGVLAGIPISWDFPELGDGSLLVSVTEKRTRSELELYREIVTGIGGRK
jgi:glycine dehydrogenase subunit 1